MEGTGTLKFELWMLEVTVSQRAPEITEHAHLLGRPKTRARHLLVEKDCMRRRKQSSGCSCTYS